MAIAWYERLLGRVFRRVNQVKVWHQLPFPLAVVNLAALRVNLRLHNLYDTQTEPAQAPPPNGFDFRHNRTADGSYNDLGAPSMGMAHTRFGRNVPITETFGETEPGIYEPSPRLISSRLLARKEFVPATTLNVLVPAWLQFMVHDWLSHGSHDTQSPPFNIPLPEGDDWPAKEMTVLRTGPDPTRGEADKGRPATFLNAETPWWDSSQIYGSSLARQMQVRSDPESGKPLADGKLYLDRQGHLPIDPEAKTPNLELAGVNGNWWIGLSVMHTLFAREHNAIVDYLALEYPDQDGEWLFQKARLINNALIVKIHTVEWTPALLDTPELRFGMRGNWWGVLGETYFRAYGRRAHSEILSGIPNSPQDHHSAPYSITEEFTAVYRMHSLIPDDFSFRRCSDDSEIEVRSLVDVAGAKTREIFNSAPLVDALYSLGTSHPGALRLHNFPANLRQMPEKPEQGIFLDLAAIDILRDRERGVPRYCQFLRLIDMKPPKSFAELTDNPEWQRELEEIYGDIEKVDLLVGALAENLPKGFAFSDTAFRIFILMASRRIKSDRFLTDDFTPDVYTPAGMRWIEDNSMRTVLLRHFPELAPRLEDVRNVFFPWAKGRG